jgi:hypothetical protein
LHLKKKKKKQQKGLRFCFTVQSFFLKKNQNDVISQGQNGERKQDECTRNTRDPLTVMFDASD